MKWGMAGKKKERGRLARNAALGRGDTLILAFSREGRRDPLAGVWGWFRMAGLSPAAALARDTLILAFSREGRGDTLAGVWGWFRMAGLLAAGRGLDARDTLTLALSRKGRGDPLGALGAWFRGAGLSHATPRLRAAAPSP